MASGPVSRVSADPHTGVPHALRPLPRALRPMDGGAAPEEGVLPCVLLAMPTVSPPASPARDSSPSPLASLQAFWGAPTKDRRLRVRERLADVAGGGDSAPPAAAPPPWFPTTPVPQEEPEEAQQVAPAQAEAPAAPPSAPRPAPPGAPPGDRQLSTRVVRTRPTPTRRLQQVARQAGATDGGEVRIVTGPAVRAALEDAGAEAATVGSTVLLPEPPDGSPRALGVLAHELVHAAEPRATTRFLGGEPDGEEERARRIGEAVERAAGGAHALPQGDVQQLTAALSRLAAGAPAAAANSSAQEGQMTALVEALGDRLLDEIDRRGGRYLGVLR